LLAWLAWSHPPWLLLLLLSVLSALREPLRAIDGVGAGLTCAY